MERIYTRVPRGKNGPPTDEARNQRFIQLFVSGKTQPEIGAAFHVDGRTVGRVLRDYGVKRSEGGKEVAAQIRKEQKAVAARVEYLRSLDCTAAEFGDDNEFKNGLRRFKEQRKRARERDIEWSLSFGDWWRIWARSGLWANRGRGSGESAVMARFYDEGPYSATNVYITTLAVNFSESHHVRGHVAKLFRGHAPSVLFNASR